MADEQQQQFEKLPTNQAEDVEYSRELADEDDLEAQERARQADKRQEQKAIHNIKGR